MATQPVEASHAPEHGHAEVAWWRHYLFSTDHKMIAMQYMFTGMAMGLLAGFFAYVFRMQMAFPGVSVPGWGIVTPGEYNLLVTNHGAIMIFWVAMPGLFAPSGLPIPSCGRRRPGVPRINRLSYQIFLLSVVVLIASFFVPARLRRRRTMYPPLSAKAE